MTVTIEQAQKIRLLSDVELYDKSIEIVAAHLTTKVSKTQLSGLQNAVGAGDWSEIFRYIDNRLNRNTTSGELKKFYQDLKNYLNELPKRVEETQLVVKPEEMGRAQRRQVNEEIGRYAHLLAKEFIQHLVAEYNYQRSLSNA